MRATTSRWERRRDAWRRLVAQPAVVVPGPAGFDLIVRPNLVLMAPKATADLGDDAAAAVRAQRSALIHGQCAACGRRLEITQRGPACYHEVACPGRPLSSTINIGRNRRTPERPST